MLADVIAYVLSIRHGGSFLGGPSKHVAERYGAIGFELSHGRRWQTIFEALVLHGGFVQLLANVVALAIFGPNVEDATGRLRFPAFYLLGGLSALGLGVLLAPNSTVPLLGGSGATAAVLGGYVLLYPRAHVLSLSLVPFFATVLAVPAVLLIGVWWAVQLWLGAAGLADPFAGDWGVAYAGLVGALLLGLLLIRPFASAARISAKGHRPPPQPVY
ncbi:MAG TPA: rhomboid family intramembrane serine protease [Solirubrobacteraceae bacterium]|nr:rhomboid family intramembrane serine protease [Solirubrobacteraceae bacterium]